MTPPSLVHADLSHSVGQADQVGLDTLSGYVSAWTHQPLAEGVTANTVSACVFGFRRQIVTERRDDIDVQVKIERREEGCAQDVSGYTFDPLGGGAGALASLRTTVPTQRTTSTHVRPIAGGAWELEGSEVTGSSSAVDLVWTATGIPVPDPGVCIIFGPPFVQPCKPHLAAVRQDAAMSGSAGIAGLSITPQAGVTYWGAFGP